MAYKQNAGRDDLKNSNIAALTKPYKKGDLNKAIYSANKAIQNIKANGLGTAQPVEPISNPKLSTFRVRGTEAYKDAVQPKGEAITSGDISKGFTKEGSDKKYPYLSSRFNTNPQIKDPMNRNATQTMRQKYLLDDYRDNRTYADIEKTNQDKRARTSYQNHPKIMKEAEKAAKLSYNISKDLTSAQSTGSESKMLSALNQAITSTRSNQYLRSHPAQVKRNGNWEKNDPVSYENASMIQRYINRSQRGSKRQDNADIFKYAGQDLKRNINSGKYDLNTNNNSNKNINSSNIFKSKKKKDITSGFNF